MQKPTVCVTSWLHKRFNWVMDRELFVVRLNKELVKTEEHARKNYEEWVILRGRIHAMLSKVRRWARGA